MRGLSVGRRAGLAGLAALVTAGAWTVPATGGVGAATTQGTLVGEGGDAATPILVKLIHDDTAGLAPDFGAYTNVDVDQGIADFVGTAPGTFGNDFAVTERPFTTSEAASAQANGRSFAYVPIAAVPVALMTLVPNSSYQGSSTITPSQFCQHIPLSLDQLDGIYGDVSPPYSAGWGDSRLSCTAPPNSPAEQYSFGLWANLDPTMENFALMSLLDSTPTSKSAFAAGLASAQSVGQSTTSDPTASEHWPYGKTVPGGDQTTFGKLIGLDPRTNVPSTQAAVVQLGAIMPVADVWTGDPLGVRWSLPTAAIQNAAGDFVVPSAGAAKAAEAGATLASTSDPTTNNLVTFNANTTDPAGCAETDTCPYNNWLMLESYMVVPTNGLPADKALALSQFIRFAVGGTGQADIASLGAAGASPAMVTADLAVAQQLDAQAATASDSPSTTTTTNSTTTTTSAASLSSTPGSSSGAAPAAATASGSNSTGGLATTGGDPSLLVGVGLTLLICGELARQLLRRRKAKA